MHFFGASYKPHKAGQLKSLASFDINNTATINGSGSSFFGLDATIISRGDQNFPISTIRIERCTGEIQFSGSNTTYLNYSIVNNYKLYISGPNTSALNDATFSSFVINNNTVDYLLLKTTKPSSIIFSNNIFLGQYTYVSSYSTYYNNIFISGLDNSNAEHNSYYNNLSYLGNTSFNLTNTNTGSGNIENVDPLFVNTTNSVIKHNRNKYFKTC